uniref:Laminin EGF-like domain-containing protein n=1 Tax=Steinernema glaseri TaxID=37863 RepID=A0A1I7YDB2_9BILA
MKSIALLLTFLVFLDCSIAWDCYPAPYPRVCKSGYELIPMPGSATCCGSPVDPPTQPACIPCNDGCPDGYRQVTDYKYCACCNP